LDNLKELNQIGLNEKSVVLLEHYFGRIGKGSIISHNDILRNIMQKLMIDNVIDKLLDMDVIYEYNNDCFEDYMDAEDITYKLSESFNFVKVERMEEPKFIHSADIIRTISKLKKSYNDSNKDEIDDLINTFVRSASLIK
jgi:hypothetical protein